MFSAFMDVLLIKFQCSFVYILKEMSGGFDQSDSLLMINGAR